MSGSLNPKPAPDDVAVLTGHEDALPGLRPVAVALMGALRSGGTAPDGAAQLEGWLEASTGGELIRVEQPHVEALVALGVIGRVVAEGRSRLVAIEHASIGRATHFELELDALESLADALGRVMPRGGSIAEGVESVAAALDDAVPVSARQVEALVALGVLGKITSAGQTRLLWMRDGDVGATSTIDQGAAEFRLDLAIDLEHERRLLYRVALAFEVVALIVIIRQIVLGFI